MSEITTKNKSPDMYIIERGKNPENNYYKTYYHEQTKRCMQQVC